MPVPVLKFYVLIMPLLLSCNNEFKNDITVAGQALDAKAGAVVISNSDKKMYYVDGISSWSKDVYGKNVKVSGRLLIENFKITPTKKEEPQEQKIVGIKRIILNPKWKLLN
ncbi:MAG: hypothetical protein HYX40_10225 [Sphingobacteriales bacterium]|nr:hypothetical protein [Sphingobacteriales bacterium]